MMGMDFEAVEREADQHAEALMCPQPAVVVLAMQGDPRYAKCPRCWHFHGALLNHDALCDRCCNSILEGWPDHESVPFIRANRAAQARYFARATVENAARTQREQVGGA